ncbi:hypothetical protein TWF281_002776 [Arthrobotrys megalospora]
MDSAYPTIMGETAAPKSPSPSTAGVLTLLGSLVALSLTFSERFQRRFQDAESSRAQPEPEIQQLSKEINNLNSYIKQIEAARAQSRIPQGLSDHLETIFEKLNTAVVEIDDFLKASLKESNLNGRLYWEDAGKRECAGFCQRLEAYKLTLEITLTWSTVSSTQLQTRFNKIRSGIQYTDTPDATGRDYVLQLFLGELESVYENSNGRGAVSTVGGRDIYDNDQDTATLVNTIVPATNIPWKGRASSVDEDGPPPISTRHLEPARPIPERRAPCVDIKGPQSDLREKDGRILKYHITNDSDRPPPISPRHLEPTRPIPAKRGVTSPVVSLLPSCDRPPPISPRHLEPVRPIPPRLPRFFP